MTEVNKIYNCDCLELMKNMHNDNFQVDLILTSPPYNISQHDFDYDVYNDNKSSEDYSNFIIDVFRGFDEILKTDGVIIWNSSYGNSNISEYFKLIYRIINESNFDIVDRIIWKKKSAMPDNQNPNKLTRIVEDIFIFARKSEIKTYKTNKKISSVRDRTNQIMYSSILNFIEAKNNDGVNGLNNATFSKDLVKKLLKIYAPENSIVYDCFMGTGTTAVACKESKCIYIGSEISEKQVEYANKRLSDEPIELQDSDFQLF